MAGDIIYWPEQDLGDVCDCGDLHVLPTYVRHNTRTGLMDYKLRAHRWFLLITWLRTCRPRV